MPIVGFLVIASLFIVGYIYANLIFRKKLILENLGVVKDLINNR